MTPADWWLEEAPKVKWLNMVASSVLSATHAAGGDERNWSTHGHILSDNRRSMAPAQLERYMVAHVPQHAAARPADRVKSRGRSAKKKLAEPKSYPVAKGDWSSCDESEDELSILWDAIVATWGS